jgi:hypothetical protein
MRGRRWISGKKIAELEKASRQSAGAQSAPGEEQHDDQP